VPRERLATTLTTLSSPRRRDHWLRRPVIPVRECDRPSGEDEIANFRQRRQLVRALQRYKAVLALISSHPSSAFILPCTLSIIKKPPTPTPRCTHSSCSSPPLAWSPLLPPPKSMRVKSSKSLQSTATPAAGAPAPSAYEPSTLQASHTDYLQNIAGSGDLYPGCNPITDACQASLKLNYVNAGCKGIVPNFSVYC
jgi:hypothetical protein